MSALARALGVSHATVGRWADTEHAAAMTLGDVLAAPASFARATLVAALAQLDGEEPASSEPLERHAMRLAAATGEVAASSEPLERHAMRLAAATGEVAAEVSAALLDGRITTEEAASIQKALLKLDTCQRRASRAVRAAGGGQ